MHLDVKWVLYNAKIYKREKVLTDKTYILQDPQNLGV